LQQLTPEQQAQMQAQQAMWEQQAQMQAQQGGMMPSPQPQPADGSQARLCYFLVRPEMIHQLGFLQGPDGSQPGTPSQHMGDGAFNAFLGAYLVASS
jgi:hypothetical protein